MGYTSIHLEPLAHNHLSVETVTGFAVDAHNFTRQAEIINPPVGWRTKPSPQSHMLKVSRKRQKDTKGKRQRSPNNMPCMHRGGEQV